MATEKNLVNLTITMSKEDRKAIKKLALDRDTNVSALIRKWLEEELKCDDMEVHRG